MVTIQSNIDPEELAKYLSDNERVLLIENLFKYLKTEEQKKFLVQTFALGYFDKNEQKDIINNLKEIENESEIFRKRG